MCALEVGGRSPPAQGAVRDIVRPFEPDDGKSGRPCTIMAAD